MKRTLILTLLAALVLAGCGIPLYPRSVDLSTLEKEPSPAELLRQQSASAPLAAPGFDEQLVTAPSAAAAGDERLYSFAFNEQPLVDALQVVLGDQPLSLSVDESVNLKRPVTVFLRNGTLREALDLLVGKGAGYVWKLSGDRLEINAFEERIYPFDFLDLAATTEIEVGGDMLASSVKDTGVAGKFSVKGKREEKRTDLWSQVETALTGMKSKGGKLQINRGSGLIYIVDTPATVASMARFLDSLKETMQRQVFIEARIIDVQLNDEFRYGIDWTRIQAALDPGNLGSLIPDQLNLSLNGNGSLIFSETTSFGAVVDLLQTQGDVSVLSNPHLSVMNNQSAVMTVGSQFPFASVDSVSRDQETAVVTIDGTIKRAVFGMQLGITPYISGDGMVTLHLVPTITRNEGTETINMPVSGTGDIQVNNPIIGLQELATTVRVREGQSVVLAGLITQEKAQTAAGLPWLRKLPVIGFFFGNGEEVKRHRELVILIKPYIKRPG